MQKTIGIILSGGRGTRMGGVDKGLQLFNSRPMIAWLIESLKPQVDGLIISINRNQDDYAKFAETTIHDNSEEQWQGPIAGILAAAEELKHNGYSKLLICPCDSPNLSKDYAARMQLALNNGDCDVAVAHDGHRIQNLHCLIGISAVDSLKRFYADGGRAMHTWLQQSKAIEVDFSDQADSFINLNTTEQLN